MGRIVLNIKKLKIHTAIIGGKNIACMLPINNFINKIELVGGDEWHGGNLSYHLKSRPTWDNILEAKKTITPKDIDGGFVLIGNADILLKICSGIFFEAETQGICMIGTKK